MTEADNTPTMPSESPALLALEEPIRELAAASKLLGHMASSGRESGGEEIAAVQSMIHRAHTAIERWADAVARRREAGLLVTHSKTAGGQN